jgi:hypothetical protein
MDKVRSALTLWFPLVSRYVGMGGLAYELSIRHYDPFVIGTLAAMMGLGHILPATTSASEPEEKS